MKYKDLVVICTISEIRKEAEDQYCSSAEIVDIRMRGAPCLQIGTEYLQNEYITM